MKNPFGNLAGIRVDVRNFALVTHAVPAERVRPHLPERYELQTFVDPDGLERCFISATCFCNGSFRPAVPGFPRHTFNESTYRAYVRHDDVDNGVYFFGRFLGTALATSAQKSLARDTFRGDFDVTTEATEDGYRYYSCHVTSARGETSFAFSALDEPVPKHPFTSAYEYEQFLTYRTHGFFTSTVGIQGHMPVSHPRMDPYEGRLDGGRFDLWHEMGVLLPDEADDAYSVLAVREVPFTLHPPRPL